MCEFCNSFNACVFVPGFIAGWLLGQWLVGRRERKARERRERDFWKQTGQ